MLRETKIVMNTADWSWFAGGSIIGFIWNIGFLGFSATDVIQYFLTLLGAAGIGLATLLGKKIGEVIFPVIGAYLKRKLKIKEKK